MYKRTSKGPPYRKRYLLAKVTPPRVGDQTLSAMVNLLSALSSEGSIQSLEIVGTHEDVFLMHRAERDDTRFRAMMTAHVPAARVDAVRSEDDPLLVRPDEEGFTLTLRVEGAPYLPLRAFDNLDLQADHGADPMAAIIGAHASMDAHERVVSRIVLKPLDRDWSEPYKRLGLGGAGSHNFEKSMEEQREKSEASRSSGDGDGRGMLPAFGALVWWKRRGTSSELDDYVDPALVQTRIGDMAYQIEIDVTVIVKKDMGSQNSARMRMRGVIQAFKIFDRSLGSRLVVDGDIRPHTGSENFLEFSEPEKKWDRLFSFLQKEKCLRSVIGLREVASMWHLPTRQDKSIALVKNYFLDLAPPREMKYVEGAYVGDSTIGSEQKIMFSPDMTRRHQFIIARTGMGKSTFIEHCVSHKLAQKALGLDNDAIVVVDPHSDLIQSLLELMPPELDKRVWLIDLADEEHVPGINVLDAHVFPDRDHTCDGVVRVTKGIWENWGSRMQNILEHTIKSLHEANAHPDTPREKQYTLLDGMRMLSEDDFRATVLEKVHDPFLLRYWRDEFEKMRPQLRSQAVAPVQTRLAYFASSKRTRDILGQRSSTLDIRKAIENGDIIFVNTAQAIVGRDVAAIVGASILNLVDAVIRRQGLKPEGDRRGVYVVVDEMQTIPGVNFQGMLSEVRKVGGALCLVTQSLAALSDLRDTMRDVLLANMGCLVVFQVAAVDAQRLVWELGRETLSGDDITSLPEHHAYVRATVEGKRIPAFSMNLRYPQTGDPERAAAIRELSGAYTQTAEAVEAMFVREDYESRADAFGSTDVLTESETCYSETLSAAAKGQRALSINARIRSIGTSRPRPQDSETNGTADIDSSGKESRNGIVDRGDLSDRDINIQRLDQGSCY